MLRATFLIALLYVSWPLQAYDLSDLWLQKSHGGYKVRVFRVLGKEHAYDHVEVQIYDVADDGTSTLKETIELPTPGYKGYIRDVSFNTISETRVAITFQVDMKAMEGVILTELFIVEQSGKFKRVLEAEYVDLYMEL